MATDGVDETIVQYFSRMIDVAEEPLEYLAPISGYAKMPLVSLEEAVEPLVPILPAVQAYARVAKQRCTKPADGLTHNESASIMLYTMQWKPFDECLYVVLNRTLRFKSQDRLEKLEPWHLYLRLLLNALLRLSPQKAIIYRGVKLDIRERYLKDTSYIWWGFSSCTTSIGVLDSKLFLGKTGPRVMFNIECESARDIRNHSYYSNEDELLLLPATEFRLISHLDQGDLHIIQLKETRPTIPLFESVPIIVPPLNDPVLTESKPVLPIINFIKLPKPTYRNEKLEQLINENKMSYELNLSSKELTDQDMQIVAYYAIQENTTLTKLNLANNQIGDEGIKFLGDGLLHSTTLTTLNLWNNQIGNEGARHLSNVLKQNTTLIKLNLYHNQIGTEGARYLSDALIKNTTLTILNLWNNKIGVEGAKYLSIGLRQNTKLARLDLGWNQIGDEGAKHISDGLKYNTTLTTLDLRDNQIGDEGAKHLLELKKNNTIVMSFGSINFISSKLCT